MTIADKLRTTKRIISNRGMGAHAGYLEEAIQALEGGADVGNLLAERDALINVRDELISCIRELEEENDQLKFRLSQWPLEEKDQT